MNISDLRSDLKEISFANLQKMKFKDYGGKKSK